MALQLLLGNSGAGKTHYIFEKIIKESMEYPKKQFLLIVPEQFTLQTQKDLVSMHPRHGIMNIDVLSFERLAHRVFDEVGTEHRKILEDTGKNLILRKLAEEKKQELTLLGGNLKKLGYITEVKALISEFIQYRITPEDLQHMIEQNKNQPQLYFKLKDMLLIYESFRSYLENTYLTSEELLEALSDTIMDSKSVKGSVIVLDGYTGFTPIQRNLLKRLFVLAEDVYITLTMDSKEKPFVLDAEYQLFHMSKKEALGLVRLADEVKVPVKEALLFGNAEKCRYQNAKALAFLEAKIFRHGREFFAGNTEELQLYAAKTPRAEAEQIAKEIQRLVRDKGFRYKEIAVVTGNLDTYGALMEQVFAQFEIPGFIDRKRDVLQNPFVEFLRALLAAVQENFSYEATFRLLRTGLLGFTSEEVDDLENYVIARGIRNFSAWNREWNYPLKDMQEEELAQLNNLRERFVSEIEVLKRELKRRDASVYDRTKVIYEYLVQLGMEQQLLQYQEEFEEAGNHPLAREYAQIYEIVMDLFDKLVLLLGNCLMDLEEYTELLEAGLAELKVGLIPAGMDQVLVGDMERSRLKDIKVVFFAGVNEGSIPKEKSRAGIISEMERELLLEQEVELAPSSRQEAYIQKFYIYLNLTKPSEKLYLSWSLADADGNALRASHLITQIQQLFPDVLIQSEDSFSFLDNLVTPRSSLREVTKSLQAMKEQKATKEQEALVQWYEEREESKDLFERVLSSVCFVYQEDSIGKSVARALYGTLLESSVTRLEQFASCAYGHFLRYGLQLQERETYGLEPIDMGNIFHDALKQFSDKIEQSNYDWFHVPEAERELWMGEALREAVEAHAQKLLSPKAKDVYTLERVRRVSQRTAWAMLQQLEKGYFLPENTELSFKNLEQLSSVSVLLSKEERMRLHGRIDRVDVYRKDGKVYVRVIDYKSGNTKFDLTSVYYGLQLQLSVYLNAALELEKRKQEGEVHPAGMFYYHIEDPMLDYHEEGSAERQLLKELAWNGLVNADKEIVHYMDKEMELESDILPVKLKKDGSYTANSSVAEEKQLELLLQHVQRQLIDYGSKILEGDISMQPYELGEQDACMYCSYHSVCGFDGKIEGCKKKNLPPLKKEDIWERLKNEEGEG